MKDEFKHSDHCNHASAKWLYSRRWLEKFHPEVFQELIGLVEIKDPDKLRTDSLKFFA